MRAHPGVALLAAVLLAGCTLPAGGATGTPTTVTPASVPNETTPLNLGPPVGVGDSLARVVEAHRQALNGTAFAYRAVYRGPVPNRPGQVQNATVRAFVGANESRYYLRADVWTGVYRQWSNGTVFVSLRTDADGRRGGVGQPALPGDSQASRLADAFLFPPEGTTVTGVVRDGNVYRITARVDPETRASVFQRSRVPNATVRVVVGRDRVIRTYRLDYAVVHDGERIRGVERYTYETGPSVTFPRPDWVDNVLANESG